jgi:hypothetical protein
MSKPSTQFLKSGQSLDNRDNDRSDLSEPLLALFEKINNQPDLKELVPYLYPMVLKANTALVLNEKTGLSLAQIEDFRKIENILTKDLPGTIENYLAMPLDYRNGKSQKSDNRLTHREILIQSFELLIQALKDIEKRNLEIFEQKAYVTQKVIRQKYAVDVEPENEFKGDFNWQDYQRNNPPKLEEIIFTKQNQTPLNPQADKKEDVNVIQPVDKKSSSAFLSMFSEIWNATGMQEKLKKFQRAQMHYQFRYSKVHRDFTMNQETNWRNESSKALLEFTFTHKYSKKEIRYYLISMMEEMDKTYNRLTEKTRYRLDISNTIQSLSESDEYMKNLSETLKNSIVILHRKYPEAFEKGGLFNELQNGLSHSNMWVKEALYLAKECEQVKKDLSSHKWITNLSSARWFVISKNPEVVSYYLDNLLDISHLRSQAWNTALINMTWFAYEKAKDSPETSKILDFDKYQKLYDNTNDNKFYVYGHMAKLIARIRSGKYSDPETLIKEQDVSNENDVNPHLIERKQLKI